MSSQLEIPCLGRPFKLGMLYDCRTDKLIAGLTLWNAKKLESAKHTSQVKTPSCLGNPTIEDTIKDKLSSVGADAQLKLSFMSGMVEVDGAVKFLRD